MCRKGDIVLISVNSICFFSGRAALIPDRDRQEREANMVFIYRHTTLPSVRRSGGMHRLAVRLALLRRVKMYSKKTPLKLLFDNYVAILLTV